MKQFITLNNSDMIRQPKAGWWGKVLRWFGHPRTKLRVGGAKITIGPRWKDGKHRVYGPKWRKNNLKLHEEIMAGGE